MEVEKVKLHPIWKEAVKKFLDSDFKPGDVVSHKWLWEAFEIPPLALNTPWHESKRINFLFLSCIEPFRQTLLEKHQIDLQNKYGKGYVWIRPEDQTKAAYKDGIKGIRTHLKTMNSRLENTDLKALDHVQRKENADAIAKLVFLQSMARRVRTIEPNQSLDNASSK